MTGESRDVLVDVLDKDPPESLDVNEAIEEAGCGPGTGFLLFTSYAIIALEAVEVTILAVVGLVLRCEWNLSTASMTCLQVSSVVGQFIVALRFSHVAEKFGRKPIMLTGAVGLTVFGLLSGLWSQQFWQLFLCRVLVGATIALCTPAAAIYPVEVSPISHRTMAQSGIGVAWGSGSILTSVIAYFTLEKFGWRGFLACSALLCSPVILLVALAKESPRYDAYRNRLGSAEETIRFLHKWNGHGTKMSRSLRDSNKDMGSDKWKQPEETTISGLLKTLNKTGKTRDLIFIINMLALSVFVYNSVAFSSPRFLNEQYCGSVTVSRNQSCVFDKNVLLDIGMVGLSEPIGSVILMYLLDSLGRRGANAAITTVTFLVLSGLHICVNRAYLVFLLMALKGLGNMVTSVPLVLIREHFPTRVRGFSFHLAYMVARVAVILGMSVTQLAYDVSPRLVLVINQLVVVLSLINQAYLKVETLGVPIE